jgi:hypothetical protein
MREPQFPLGRATSRPAPDDFVEFARAGTRAKGQFECTACGHQIVSRAALPHCTLCGEGLWERSAWSPFGASLPK